MVDIILNSICYDPGYLANFADSFNGYVSTMIQQNKPGQYVTAATRYSQQAEQKIDEYRELISKIDDNY
jgi:hypothetical protein